MTQLQDDGSSRTDEADQADEADGTAEVWRVVRVERVELELPGAYPDVVLAEKQPPWERLRVPIGFSEGNAIAYALRGIEVPRPLTHDLMTELLERHAVEVAGLRITARHNGVYFAELETMGPKGRALVPCRPSDGIALALRQRMEVPIVVATWLFGESGETG